MINILHDLPPKMFVAVSGGMDSMVFLDFLIRGRKDIKVLHYNHGTPHGEDAEKFVTEYCNEKEIPLTIGRWGGSEILKGEQSFRDARYDFFYAAMKGSCRKLITCHHLEDQVETYIFYMLRGYVKFIPYARTPGIIRPFLLVPKHRILNYQKDKDVPYIKDPSNDENHYSRNRIRNMILPQIRRINPGIETTVTKLFQKSDYSGPDPYSYGE